MKQIKGFKNSYILTEEGIKKTNLIIKDGIILSIGDQTIDGMIELDEDKILVPGFIDQHIHGALGVDTIDGNIENISIIAHALPREGITAFLPTTTTQSVEVIDKALNAVKEYIYNNDETAAIVLGTHLEGPFISEKYMGAQNKNYILKPSVDIFKHFEQVSQNTIKIVSLQIEEESKELIEYLKSKNIIVSIGHSDSKYEDVKESIKQGVTCITHTYNAMKPIHHREIGTVGSAMLFDELYSELICDGIHVCKEAVKLLHKNKPQDKLILISDALRTKYMPDGIYHELDQTIILKNKKVTLEDGTLAGSVLKLNEAVKNLMDYTGTDLITSIKCVTENPSKNLGIFDKMGSIKENKLANFVIIDKNINIYQTIIKGIVVYKK